jgi:Bacterial extracellular solute-binding protein
VLLDFPAASSAVPFSLVVSGGFRRWTRMLGAWSRECMDETEKARADRCSALVLAPALPSGESLVTFDTIASISMNVKKQGQPQAVAFSEADPLPIWPFTAAIFKDAPHPDAAKLFVSWYLSPEQQAKTGNWSPRSDVPAPYGRKPILSYKVVNKYREYLTNTKQLEELRKRFESYTGSVKNVGGVR